MNLEDFMLIVYTFIVIIMIIYVLLKNKKLVYDYTNIDLNKFMREVEFFINKNI